MFQATTTYVDGSDVPAKPFAWSYSRLKNYRACPKKMMHYDLLKDVPKEQSEALDYGFEVHNAMANRIKKGTPLPALLKHCESWAARFLLGQGAPNVKILVEQKLAIRKDFSPCGYFDKGVWFRAVGDAIKIVSHGGTSVGVYWDWKTGKIKKETEQLLTSAATMFAHYPELQYVRADFIWLDHGAHTRVDIKRSELPQLWGNLMPEIDLLEKAHQTMTFPPKPGGLCREWCGVTSCPYHGKGA